MSWLILLEQLPEGRVIPEELGSAQEGKLCLYLVRPAQQAIPGKAQEIIIINQWQMGRWSPRLRLPKSQHRYDVQHVSPFNPLNLGNAH